MYIAMVKLKTAKQYLKEYYCIASDAVCYQETDLLLGVKYLNDLASALDLPLVMCITVGTNMGGHVGTLPLPSQLGAYSLVANRIAVIGTGNEADKRIIITIPSRISATPRPLRSGSGKMSPALCWNSGS